MKRRAHLVACLKMKAYLTKPAGVHEPGSGRYSKIQDMPSSLLSDVKMAIKKVPWRSAFSASFQPSDSFVMSSYVITGPSTGIGVS
jgi:hypothetical protein